MSYQEMLHLLMRGATADTFSVQNDALHMNGITATLQQHSNVMHY